MCLFSRFFGCNNCNRSSLCQNVRMTCTDARGDDDCAREDTRSGCTRSRRENDRESGCGCDRD